MSDISMRFRESYFNEQVESVDEADSTIVEEEIFEECDWFVQLEDSLFYVSEYHNALFDDPDAHDDAINEFGILLDSYGEELVQEVASVGPYDEYLKKHKYDPKNNTIEDPNRPGKRVSAGKIGSEKERRRMNKFLRENGYDPKTETIQTDVNDPKNKGTKMRVKFTMNPSESSHYNRETSTINIVPRSMGSKPLVSNAIYKHEEGHTNQDYGDWRDIKDRTDTARDYVDNKSGLRDFELKHRAKISDHDQDSYEYDADAYSNQHNRHDKHGTGMMSYLAGRTTQHKQRFSRFNRSLDKLVQKRGIQSGTIEADRKQQIAFIKTHRNNPGANATDDQWISYLKRTYPNPEMFKTFERCTSEITSAESQLSAIKKPMLAKLDVIKNKYGDDSEEFLDAYSEFKTRTAPYKTKIDKLKAESREGDIHLLIDDLKELSALSDSELSKMDQDMTDRGLAVTKRKIQSEKRYRDPDEMAFAHQKRGEFAKQQWDKQQEQRNVESAKKRQLSKEELRQQIDSGKLSRDQLAKAKRKLQRIEQFEKSQRK